MNRPRYCGVTARDHHRDSVDDAKDFGGGYVYKVLIEEATLQP